MHFDLDALREALGEKRFRRAEAYADGGRVRIMALEAGRVAAQVTGERGDVYGVEVEESGAGACTCPDFAETGTCKHVGALALCAEGLEPAQIRVLTERFVRLREALRFEDQEALTALILDLAKRIPGVLEALEMANGAAGAALGSESDAAVIFT